MSCVGSRGSGSLVLSGSNKVHIPMDSELKVKTIKSDEKVLMKSYHLGDTSLPSSPDSSSTEDHRGQSGSPGSSNGGPFRCLQCHVDFEDNSMFADHLLRVHRSKLIKTEQPCTVSTTRCPVCRLQVADLSHHFAMDHAQKSVSNLNNNNNNYNDSKPVTNNGVFLKVVEQPNVIPVFLPVQPLPEEHLRSQMSGDDEPASPINLTMRRNIACEGDLHVGQSNNNVLPYNTRSGTDSEDHNSTFSEEFQTSGSSKAALDARKRRKQTHVPDASKDERYWARRMKNNEAAKRSRDMRIKREKIVFEENAKLEQDRRDLKLQLDRVSTENKELHLKLGLIMDENVRLKGLILSLQKQAKSTT